MASVQSLPTLITAEQYAELSLSDPTELIRGVVVPMPVPSYEHGRVCNEVAFHLTSYVKANQLGEVLTNDAGVVTERGPDTVRGADISFYSYERYPKSGARPAFSPVPPDAVFEVLSPSERWREVMEKVEEYLAVGVQMVCVLETEIRGIKIFTADRPMQSLRGDDEFVGIGALSGFRLPVRKLFE